jgi:HEAT repeat protein
LTAHAGVTLLSAVFPRRSIAGPIFFILLVCVAFAGCYADTPAAPRDVLSIRLVALLHEQDADVRQNAAEALGKIGSQTAAAALTAALRDKEPRVRAAAARALARMGALEAAPTLVTLLADPAPMVQEASALALGELDPDRAMEKRIVALLDSDQVATRVAAARALLGLTGIQYSPVLLSRLHDAEPAVRQATVALLGETGDSRAIPHLIERMERDLDPGVRAETAYRLGKIGDDRAHSLLRRVAQRDENSTVRLWAAWGLQLPTPPPEPGSRH